MSGRSVNLTTLFLGRLRPPKRLTSTSREANMKSLTLYHISLVIRWSFSLPKQSKKILDPSYKMDLEFLDCLGRVKLVLQQNYKGLI